MRQVFIYVILILWGCQLPAQEVFHVFPKTDPSTPGSASGDGSLDRPWDLQTALTQNTDVVNSGDTIWLHEGVYNGRYLSTLQSTRANEFITVSAFKNDKVTLNGNVDSPRNVVLDVRSKQVIFKNFEITFLGSYSRNEKDSKFKACTGVQHLNGEHSRFLNLIIHDIPGLGFGSWKDAGGSIIENCIIFNNGYLGKNGKGLGEGIYVQNKTDLTKLIKNNIIFGNYYKGIEVWSAGKRATFEFVKHITVQDNILFNNGLSSGFHRDNIIVGTADRNGINIARDIKILNNVMYHNANFTTKELAREAPSLTLGFNKNAPIENVTVSDNIILGRSNTLRILHAKSLTFSNNTVFTGYVHLGLQTLDYAHDWNFNHNHYFVNYPRPPYRIIGDKDHEFESWTSTFNIDQNSTSSPITSFDLNPVLALHPYRDHPNKFNVALFDKEGDMVTVDFSGTHLKPGHAFTIYDVENPRDILVSGKLPANYKVAIPMALTAYAEPKFSPKAKKTLSNFGVFVVEFDDEAPKEIPSQKQRNLLKRFFSWFRF
ncbi:MAG: right-handed parallel beta-helix repeat-containing protein [Algicola sp.]|nr:right-handed parallel beta-helix repeat-containing protein [Algicola sp.]